MWVLTEGLGTHNFCRNPNENKEGLWCYIFDPLDPTKVIVSFCDPRIPDSVFIADFDITVHSTAGPLMLRE